MIFSTAGQPRGRGKIERLFLTVQQVFLCHQPGYAPPGNRKAEPGPSLDTLDLAFKQWLLGEYLVQQHSETGYPPQARWEDSNFLPRLPDSRDQLDLLLLSVAVKSHVRQILEKLAVSSRTEAAVKAIRSGVLKCPCYVGLSLML